MKPPILHLTNIYIFFIFFETEFARVITHKGGSALLKSGMAEEVLSSQ